TSLLKIIINAHRPTTSYNLSGSFLASVDNEMASFLARKDDYGNNSLLEQWKESYENDDYEYDPYDDDMSKQVVFLPLRKLFAYVMGGDVGLTLIPCFTYQSVRNNTKLDFYDAVRAGTRITLKVHIPYSTSAIACDSNYKTVFLDFVFVSRNLMHIAPVFYIILSGYISDRMAKEILEKIDLRRVLNCHYMFNFVVAPTHLFLDGIFQFKKMQATFKMALVSGFKHQSDEGEAVTLQMYGLGGLFWGSAHDFDIKPYKKILDCKTKVIGQLSEFFAFQFHVYYYFIIDYVDVTCDLVFVDVIGQVVEFDEMDYFDISDKTGKKKPLKLMDYE
ncbi:hypothetical protein Tco_0743687, partial [Tanacetum coccineum]